MRSPFLALAGVLLPAAAAAQSTSWTLQAPTPVAGDLHGVRMVSPTEFFVVGSGGRVVHSADGGLTWDVQQLATDSLWAVDFVDPQRGWVAGNGFFHTTDGGQTWVKDSSWGSIYELQFLDAQRGFAAGNGGTTFRTADGGLTWSYSTVGPITTLGTIWFQDPLNGWTGNIDGELFRSMDGGLTWSLAQDLGSSNLQHVQFVGPQEGWAIGGSTFHHTTDGGQSWQATQIGGTWANEAYFLDPQHGWAVGEGGALVRTVDGGQSWTSHATGATTRLWDVHFFDPLNGVLVGESGVLRRSTDGGQTWVNLQSGGSGYVNGLDAVDDQTAFGAQRGGRVLRTVDGGQFWDAIPLPGVSEYGSAADVDFADALIGWCVAREEFFGGGTAMVFKSVDGGLNWQLQLTLGDRYMEDVEVLDAQTAFVAGHGQSGGILLRTQNGGASWQDVTPSPAAFFTQVAFVDDQVGHLVGGGLVYRTLDGGSTWSVMFHAASPLHDVSFSDPLHGWVVGWFGYVAHTSDGGFLWQAQTPAGHSETTFWTVQALSPSTAWLTGSGGYLGFTSDGGLSWRQDHQAPDDQTLEAVFLDSATGWTASSQIWRRDEVGPCTDPQPYCTGKLNSSGGFAHLGWSGAPSVSGAGMAVIVSDAMPSNLGVLYFSEVGAASMPFHQGTLCASPPVQRLAVKTLDFQGRATYPLQLAPQLAGTTRWFQFWYRDPTHPDGTAVALSNGLEVAFCP